MIKNLKFMFVFSLILSLFIACTKEDLVPALPTEPDEIETTSPDEPNTPGVSQDAFEMGTGSGNLTIDGSQAALKGKTFIVIKSGNYGNITIKNLSGTLDAPVVIKNSGQVSINSEMEISNVTNVVISGDNSSATKYGFAFHDIGYRALYLGKKIDGLTLQYLSFKDVRDYAIYSTAEKISYDGSVATRTERLKILHSKFDHSGMVNIAGEFSSSTDVGFVNDVEIAHNILENSNSGVAVYFGNVQNYNIHHNVVNNYNPTNGNHNGIFHMKGAGKFHDNKFTNYQGNMIRAWLYARIANPIPVEIYNNIAYNTRMYGAFELQGFDSFIVPGKTTYANAKVYNNTAGKMNTSKAWQGLMLDLYNYGGTLEYYNNLGFDMHDTRGEVKNDMLNNMSSVKIIKNTNNKYVASSSEAVSDLSSMISKYPGLGATQ